MPSEATFPAKRAPALPRLDSFSRSFSLLSARVGVCEVEETLSLPRVVGREPKVSAAVARPGGGVGGLNAGDRAVRWLRYNWAAGESGMEGGWGGISAPFWTRSSAIGKGMAF